MGLNYVGPLIHRYFSISMLENFSEICDNLRKVKDEPHSPEIWKKVKKLSMHEYIKSM